MIHTSTDEKTERALALLQSVETIKATGGAVEIAGVRIEPCDGRGQTATTLRADALAQALAESKPAMLLTRLVSAIYHDPATERWFGDASNEVAHGMAEAQSFTGVGR